MSKAALAFYFVLLIVAGSCPAESTVIPLNSSAPVSENFNGMGSAEHALLPVGWQLSSSSNFDGISSTTFSRGTSGSGAVATNSLGGFYNWGDGVNDLTTDRAPGFLIDSTFTQGKSLFVGFHNNTGSIINDLHISYDIEKYRRGILAVDINLLYGFDGALWNPIPDATQHFSGDSVNTAVDPPASMSRSTNLSGLAIPDQGNFYLRWVYSSLGVGNGQGLGIDNFSISFSSPQTLTWAGPNGAAWDAASSNWKSGENSPASWNDDHPDNAMFVDGGGGVGNVVNLTSLRAAGRVTFDAGLKSYTLSGSPLNLSGAAGVGLVAKSSATINNSIQISQSQQWMIDSTVTVAGGFNIGAGSKLLKRGLGTLVIGGSQFYGLDSSLQVSEGTVRLSSTSVNLNLVIGGNEGGGDAKVILGADQQIAALDISTADSGRQGLDLASPTAAGAYRLLRINTGNAAAIHGIYDLIRQAKLTPGEGIYDSGMASHPNSAIGIAATPEGDLLIRLTRIGDLNLDGKVTIADFIDFSANFNRTGVTWREGDINGDGVVTIADFIDLASNFNISYSGEAIPTSANDLRILENFAAAHGTAIPEPMYCGLTFLGALAMAGRRRVQSAK